MAARARFFFGGGWIKEKKDKLYTPSHSSRGSVMLCQVPRIIDVVPPPPLSLSRASLPLAQMVRVLMDFLQFAQTLFDALVSDEPQALPAGSTNVLPLHGQL